MPAHTAGSPTTPRMPAAGNPGGEAGATCGRLPCRPSARPPAPAHPGRTGPHRQRLRRAPRLSRPPAPRRSLRPPPAPELRHARVSTTRRWWNRVPVGVRLLGRRHRGPAASALRTVTAGRSRTRRLPPGHFSFRPARPSRVTRAEAAGRVPGARRPAQGARPRRGGAVRSLPLEIRPAVHARRTRPLPSPGGAITPSGPRRVGVPSGPHEAFGGGVRGAARRSIRGGRGGGAFPGCRLRPILDAMSPP